MFKLLFSSFCHQCLVIFTVYVLCFSQHVFLQLNDEILFPRLSKMFSLLKSQIYQSCIKVKWWTMLCYQKVSRVNTNYSDSLFANLTSYMCPWFQNINKWINVFRCRVYSSSHDSSLILILPIIMKGKSINFPLADCSFITNVYNIDTTNGLIFRHN